jgi:hypothetical protein
MTLDLIIAVLATMAMTEVLLHDHRLDTVKLVIEVNGPTWLNQLVNCGWCLSHWSAAIVTACVFLPDLVTASAWCYPRYAVIWLAVTRAANISHDVTRKFTKRYKEHGPGTGDTPHAQTQKMDE